MLTWNQGPRVSNGPRIKDRGLLFERRGNSKSSLIHFTAFFSAYSWLRSVLEINTAGRPGWFIYGHETLIEAYITMEMGCFD